MIISSATYKKIIRILPIACVDLLVMRTSGEVLLLKRKNEPAKGQWWFPGGRVHFSEMRKQAAKRKLKEECGLRSTRFLEMGTYDVILPIPGGAVSHGISTLYFVFVKAGKNIRIDGQSDDAAWRTPAEWEKIGVHSFVASGLKQVNRVVEVNRA